MYGITLRLRISLLAGSAMLAVASPSAALLLTVDTEDDQVDVVPGDGHCATSSGHCSLRAAVQEANASSGPDEIILPRGYYDLELLTVGEDDDASGDLDVTDDLTLTGEAANLSFITGGSATGVLQVWPGVRAQLRDLTLGGGLQRPGVDAAAGIDNQGSLEIADCRIGSNAASIPYGTGGLYNQGAATIERTLFATNSPTAITNSGTLFLSESRLFLNGPSAAIDNEGGDLTMIATEIEDQTGTGMFVQGSTVYIERSRIHGTRPGVAILIPGGQVTVVESLIDHNRYGGINNDGGLVVRRSTLRANSPEDDDGGSAAGVAGVSPYTAVTNTDGALITDSTIVGHRGGGLVNEEGLLTLINVTVSGNTSTTGGGGGVSNYGELVVRNSTIVGNTSTAVAGGIVTTPDAANSARISNSIVAENSGPDGAPADCAGPMQSEGYNLIGSDAGCDELAVDTGDQLGVDPQLGPLADNGGPTLTRAPLPGSPAIDAGDPAAPGSNPIACSPTDQRGAGRPRGTGCDIGAVEVSDTCGDGTLDSGEACDDGNADAGDCCSPLCTFEALAGDCNGDGAVDIGELVRAVDLALGSPPPLDCPNADADGNGLVAINDLLRAVGAALHGCEPAA